MSSLQSSGAWTGQSDRYCRLRSLIPSLLGVFLLAVVGLGGWCDGASAASEDAGRAIFQRAFQNRYVDEADLPGYEAEVSVTYDRQIYQGRVRVNPDYRVELFNLVREDVRNFAREQLDEVNAQHAPTSFETSHGDASFSLVDTDLSGAFAIEERGPDIDATYRIQNNKIVEVTRHIGDFDVTVTTFATIQPKAGYLPTEFREVIRDRETDEVISARDVRDYYMKVSKYYLLHRRLVREADSLEGLSTKPIDETAIILTGIDAIPTRAGG